MLKGYVNKIIPFSAVDGPGNRMAIFFQGCNLNCLYCHNPETIPIYSLNNKVEGITEMPVEDVLSEIKKVRPFIKGITTSGGECTLQMEFLTELFVEVKKLGLTTFIDTNGLILLENHKKFLQTVDMAMVDCKAYDKEEHKKLTGLSNKNVIENVKYLASIGKLFEIRTVVVPEILDNERNVDEFSKLIASIDPNIRYKLIKYRPMGIREDLIHKKMPTTKEMARLYAIAHKNGLKDIVII